MTPPNRPGRDLEEVAPGVWVATATIWTTTSTVVVDDGRALVVDPGVTVAEVDALAAEVERRGWRVAAGFATHPHWDHVLWTRSWGTVPRWATAVCAAEAARRARAGHEEADRLAPGHDHDLGTGLRPLPAGSATLPWPEGDSSTGSGSMARPVVVEHTAHAPGHAALVARGVLLAGDMLSDTEVPLLDESAADPFGDYRAALVLLESTVRDLSVDVLVPGHGHPARGPAQIAARFAADRAYLDALQEAVRATSPHGTPVVDPRLAGYVAQWHAAQLAALRGPSAATP
ncbi:MBL fold metallo-hydrolase [Oerskovia flava]|uniref:MBL fold metallo-hydrolase n=1 Tax=Oerskovia flava TaxID=2986422 RepID=UPI002240703B|nr:MBL fold metallo-hydrolase [Oerskovia sp. JB1-3-2]